MADITVTAASVVEYAGAVTEQVTYGTTIAQGKVVYLDATDGNKAKLAINTSAAAAEARGIALTSGASGQVGMIIRSGTQSTPSGLNPGGTVNVGTVYAVSGTAGGIAPIADVAVGRFTTVLGIGTTTSRINVDIQAGGVALT